jgi:hypothetical protein
MLDSYQVANFSGTGELGGHQLRRMIAPCSGELGTRGRGGGGVWFAVRALSPAVLKAASHKLESLIKFTGVGICYGE